MSISVPPLITVPQAIAYRNAVGRTVPLTSIEVDQNMAFLHNEADVRLKIEDYTSTSIINKLNSDSLSAGPGGIDSFKLRGLAPETENIASSLVLRDGSGDFAARQITADLFIGNASTSDLAQAATKLETPRKINGADFDGTEDITIYDTTAFSKNGGFLNGRLVLVAPTVSAQDGVELTVIKVQRDTSGLVTIETQEVHNYSVGQFVTVSVEDEFSVNVTNVPIESSGEKTFTYKTTETVVIPETTVTASTSKCKVESLGTLNIPVITGDLSAPEEGDIWCTGDGLFNRVGNKSRRIAYLDSDIQGTAANVTQVVAIENGGTGVTSAEEARLVLGAASAGINEDITGLRGLLEPLPYDAGGTGLSSPGPEGNILMSDGTAWQSTTPYYPVSGMITYFASENPPTGWLACYGQLLLKSEYPNLYNAIGLRFTETILQLIELDAGVATDGVVPGFGTAVVPSGNGLGETGGFNTTGLGGGSYLRFGTQTTTTHGTILTVLSSIISNNVATLTFSTQASAPFAVGDRILVSLTAGDSIYYNGAWEVSACTTTYVKFTVPTYSRPLRSSSNIGSVQRSRWAKFTVNAKFANRMSFAAIRGNDTNGGEKPENPTDSLVLYYKDKSTGFLTKIANIYPSAGDPYATAEEVSDAYAADWKVRAVTIPYQARQDGQTFEIHQSSVGAEFSSTYITSGAKRLVASDQATGALKLYGSSASTSTFNQVMVGDYLTLAGWQGTELSTLNGTFQVTNKTVETLESGETMTVLWFTIARPVTFETVEIPTYITSPSTKITGSIRNYSGYPGLADAFGVKALYFYEIQSEDSVNFSFRLPDLRGEFIRGWDAGRGVDLGRQLGTLQLDAVGQHRHNLIGDYGTPFFAVNPYAPYLGEYGTVGSTVRAGSAGIMTVVTGGVDGSFDRETRPRNIALLPCIKI